MMKTEQTRKVVDQALDRLAAALEHGQSDAMQGYLKTMGRFWRYSWGNQLLIAMQRPDATKVAGFQTWRSLGRYVRQGERGIAILAPVLYLIRNEAAEDDDDVAVDGIDDDGARRLAAFRTVYVFDVLQTEGTTLPEFTKVQGDPERHADRLKAFIAANGISLSYSDRLGGAEGASIGDRIIIRTGLTAAAEFSVLVHEYAHAILHQNWESRPESRTVRETEAEAVAFVVCEAIGLETSTASADYISLYAGDKDTLARSLERIQRTAANIIEGIEVVSAPRSMAA